MNSIAEKCPAKLCAAAVFFTFPGLVMFLLPVIAFFCCATCTRNSGFCHLYDECEETEPDRSALLLHREAPEQRRSTAESAGPSHCPPGHGFADLARACREGRGVQSELGFEHSSRS